MAFHEYPKAIQVDGATFIAEHADHEAQLRSVPSAAPVAPEPETVFTVPVEVVEPSVVEAAPVKSKKGKKS